MSKAKRRVKTKPRTKDAPKKATGFVGQRFVVVGGNVEEIHVAVIGEYAFKISRTQRHGLKRAFLINRNSLFATKAAALDSMKPRLGYALKYDGTVTAVRATGPVGDEVMFTRGRLVRTIWHAEFFPTKALVLGALVKKLQKDWKEKIGEATKANKKLAAIEKQLEKTK